MKTKILFIIFFISFEINAQHYLGFYLNGSTPQKSLADSGYKNGLGFSFEYLSDKLVKKKYFNIRIGIGFDIQSHGHKRIDSISAEDKNNPNISLKEKGFLLSRNNSFVLNLLLPQSFPHHLMERLFR